MNKTILIAGAGLGGAALAHGLLAAGYQVRIFDRDVEVASRAQGFRISINRMGHDALQALLPAAHAARLPAIEVADVGRGFTFATAAMRPLVRFPGDGEGVTTARRPALRQLLLDGLPVEWGRRVVGFRDDRDGVEAVLDDGATARGDLLIGADGVRSQVRAGLPDAPQIVDTGLRSVGGVVDRAGWDQRLPLNGHGAVEYLGPGGQALFVSFCERDDRRPTLLWALSRRDTGDWEAMSCADLRARCVAALSDPRWHPTLRALVEATGADDIIEPLTLMTSRFAIRRRGPMHGRVTLLGDAAHAMPPQRGLGGNSAFADAALLCRLLGEHGVSTAAIERYEQEMFARTAITVEESDQAARLCHLAHPLAVAARGVALRIAGAGMAIKARFAGASSSGF